MLSLFFDPVNHTYPPLSPLFENVIPKPIPLCANIFTPSFWLYLALCCTCNSLPFYIPFAYHLASFILYFSQCTPDPIHLYILPPTDWLISLEGGRGCVQYTCWKNKPLLFCTWNSFLTFTLALKIEIFTEYSCVLLCNARDGVYEAKWKEIGFHNGHCLGQLSRNH